MTNKQKIQNLYAKQKGAKVISMYRHATAWDLVGFIVLGTAAWGIYYATIKLIQYYG